MILFTISKNHQAHNIAKTIFLKNKIKYKIKKTLHKQYKI